MRGSAESFRLSVLSSLTKDKALCNRLPHQDIGHCQYSAKISLVGLKDHSSRTLTLQINVPADIGAEYPSTVILTVVVSCGRYRFNQMPRSSLRCVEGLFCSTTHPFPTLDNVNKVGRPAGLCNLQLNNCAALQPWQVFERAVYNERKARRLWAIQQLNLWRNKILHFPSRMCKTAPHLSAPLTSRISMSAISFRALATLKEVLNKTNIIRPNVKHP
jgi:hypothetical protein